MGGRLVSAAAAAARVGIKRATLYAYVSRRLLTAHRQTGKPGSWFDPVELDGLVRRARGPAEREPSLRITSAITLIGGGHYWYRGRSPEQLAVTTSYESVAEWLWDGREPGTRVLWPHDRLVIDQARRLQRLLPKQASPTDRLRVVVSVLGTQNPLRFDLRHQGALATARRLVASAVAALARTDDGSVAEQMASWLSPRRPTRSIVRAIDTTLTIMADHELAASTLAVRIAASFRADPYTAVVAGLGAMAGSYHGAASRPIENALRQIDGGDSAADAFSTLLRGQTLVPGFGHPLYPEGDPRVAVLLRVAQRFGPTTSAGALLNVAARQNLPPPNVDFALAVLSHRLRLPPGTGEALFTVGRLAGWLAHALEEYAEPSQLRLRTVYTGLRPD